MEREITIDLGRCFKAVFKKLWLVIICAFAGFGVLFAVMPNPTTVYYATSSVYGVSFGSYTDSMQTVNLFSYYLNVASSKKVADRAADLIGSDTISGTAIQQMTAVSNPEKTAIIYFRANSEDPVKAMTVANAMADSFIIEAQSSFGTNAVQTLDRAERVSSITGKSKLFYGLIGFLAGFLLSVIVIMLKEIFSDKLYYVSDAELNGELEILGVIPETRK